MNLPPPPITSSYNHKGPTPTDLAFALAIQEREMHRRIPPSEYIALACEDRDGCPNLSAALLFNRRIKFWVQSSILDLEFGTDKAGLERRSETKRFFIMVADVCGFTTTYRYHTHRDTCRNVTTATTSHRSGPLWMRCSHPLWLT